MSTSEQSNSPTIDRHPHFNKSNVINSILHGCEGPSSSHYADQLERFKRDFAKHHKEQQSVKQNRKKQTLNSLVYQRQNFLHNINVKDYQQQQRKETQHMVNLHLFDLGMKKNGQTSGIPINPVNHQYQNTYGGKQLQKTEHNKHIGQMVRLHHLQTKNSCGYNLLNGKENTPVHKMVKADDEPMIDSRLQTYKEHYSMRPPYFSQ